MPISSESLYQQVGALIQSMPPTFNVDGVIAPSIHRWLGQLAALLDAAGQIADLVYLKATIDSLQMPARRAGADGRIRAVAYRLLAVAELQAPAAVQGTFIPAGNQFDGLAAVGKLLQSATAEVLIVDPYMDEKALTTFAVLAAENVTIRLLADAAHVKPSLKPAASAWAAQYGGKRPVEAKLAATRTLHDRLVITDNLNAYTLGQSLNAFAVRAPTSILKADPETASLKVAAYATIWQSAIPL